MRDVIDTSPAELGDFPTHKIHDMRIEDPRVISNLLQSIMGRGTPFVIHEADGKSHLAHLWALDAKNMKMSFSEDVFSPGLNKLDDANAAVAVCYIDNIKIQFDLFDRQLVRGQQGAVLQAALPLEIFQFRRRASYRVRMDEESPPTVLLQHPSLPEGLIELKVFDLSTQGCALLMPAEFPPMRTAYEAKDAIFNLSQEVKFNLDLIVMRQALFTSRVPSIILGCEMTNLATLAQMLLRNYTSSMQKGRQVF